MSCHLVGNNKDRQSCGPHRIDPIHNREHVVPPQRTHSFCKMTNSNEYI